VKLLYQNNWLILPQVLPTCAILSKSLNRNQRAEREAAAAALSEFIRHRYLMPFFKIQVWKCSLYLQKTKEESK
jgi:hypothetical protein